MASITLLNPVPICLKVLYKCQQIIALHRKTKKAEFFNNALHHIEPRPNDSNTSTQHILTLLAQHLQALAKWSQHCLAEHVARFWRPCFNVLRHVASWKSNKCAFPGQHCRTNLVKLPQHHATSTNVAWKFWPFSNLSQQHSTCRSMLQHVATGWPKAPDNVAICCVEMLRFSVWPGLKIITICSFIILL